MNSRVLSFSHFESSLLINSKYSGLLIFIHPFTAETFSENIIQVRNIPTQRKMQEEIRQGRWTA